MLRSNVWSIGLLILIDELLESYWLVSVRDRLTSCEDNDDCWIY